MKSIRSRSTTSKHSSISKVKEETDVKSKIRTYLENSGYTVWQMTVGGRRMRGGYVPNELKGFPDLFGILKNRRGILFAIEVKRPKSRNAKAGVVSDDQVKFIDQLNDLGAYACVATSVKDVADFISRVDS